MAELYTLPDGWEWKSLNDVVFFQEGPGILKSQMSKDGIPLLNIRTFNKDETLNLTDTNFIPKETIDKKYKHFLVEVDDILVASSGSLGKMAIVRDVDLPALLNTSIIRFRPLDINKMDRMFLKYFLNSDNFSNQYNNAYTGSAIKNFGPTHLKQMNIILPPLEEQKRIVAKLDNLFAKIDKAIALHQKNIDEANVFMASVLNDVFVELEEKYKKLNINNIATIKGGKRVPKGYTLSEEITPYPYLRVTDFKDYGTICTKKMLYLTKEVYEQIKRYTITDEDLYITNVGNTIGKSGIIPSKLNGANLTENAVKLVYKDKKNTSNKFMYYFTKTSIFSIQLESATMQMAVPKLAIMRLGEIELPFPPIEVQQKIVLYLDDISQKMEKIKQIQKEKMQNLKELKASILDQTFKGEL